jgi:hypothetical protein
LRCSTSIRKQDIEGRRSIQQKKCQSLLVSPSVERNIDRLLGPNIPHPDRIEDRERRAFLLLLLFKPWRVVTDLKTVNQEWHEALLEFEQGCGECAVQNMG